MGHGSPISLPSAVEQSANTGTDLLDTLVGTLDLARNQFRARQFSETSATLDRLIAALDVPVSNPNQAARAKCIMACALILRGRCIEEQGNLNEAREIWQKAVVLFADNRVQGNPTMDMLGYYGAALRLTGDRRAAIMIFREIIAAGAAVPETYRHYGLALKDEGLATHDDALLREAHVQLRQAVEVARSDLRSLRALAELCETLGGDQETQEAAGAFYSLAEALSTAGDYPAALEAADHSLRLNTSEPKILRLRGDLLRIAGRYDEALASLDQYLSSVPDDPVGLASKGAVLYFMRRFDEALAALDRATELRENYNWAILMKGSVLFASDRTEDAGNVFESAFRLAPTFWEAASELARARLLLNEPEKALEATDQALAIKTDEPFVLSMRGLALNLLGRYEEALTSFDRAIAVSPGYAFAWSRKTLPLFMLNRVEEALTTLDRALELDPLDAWTYARKGELLSRSEDPQNKKDSIPLIEKSLALAPDAALTATLASTLQDLDMLEEAVAAADKAIQLDSKSLQAYVVKAEALRRLKRPEEGLKAVETALQIKPGLAYALGTKGQLLQDLDQNENAAEVLRAAVEAGPDSAWIWQSLGAVLNQLDRPEEALAALENAVNLDPHDPATLQYKADALTSLADNLQGKGDYTAALDRLEEAIKIAPNYATAHALLGFVLHAQGKTLPAERALDAAVALDPCLAWAHAELASVCRDLENPERALQSVNEALRLNPGYASANEIKARILIDIGENELALGLCHDAIQLDETLWTSHFWKGLAFDNLGRVEEALAEYREAHMADSEDVWIRRALADMLLLVGESGQAIEHFEFILKRTSGPNRSITELILCGWCHYGCKRLDPAIRLYTEAISQDVGNGTKSAPFDLALIIACSKRYTRARREYERAVEIASAAHPWLRKGLLGVALADLTRAAEIRHPHLQHSPEIHESMELLQKEFQKASEEPSRPTLTQPHKSTLVSAPAKAPTP